MNDDTPRSYIHQLWLKNNNRRSNISVCVSVCVGGEIEKGCKSKRAIITLVTLNSDNMYLHTQ